VISYYNPVEAKSTVRLCQDNIVFVQFSNGCGDNLDDFSITYRGRHTGTARLKAHAQALLQEWADDLFKYS